MAIFEKDRNVEAQLQVAFSTIAELQDQNEVLNKTIWSLEEHLRMSEEGREELKRFYENQMDLLRADQQKLIDAARLSAKSWRGKKYGRKSERNAGHDDTGRGNSAGEEL